MSVNYNPRIVTDGLVLVLDAANIKGYDKYENLLTQSNTDVEFSNGAAPNTWTSGYLAPDNSLTAKLCTTNNRSFKEYVSSSVNNVVSTFSIYLKSTGSSLSRTFDLRDIATDTVRTTKSIVITGEWQRFDITGTVQANGVRIEITGGIQNIYAWGAQLEKGSTANDYYPTTASTKTRGTTWTDLSGRGNNGTLTNGPTYSNGAIVFDGTDDYVICGNLSSLKITQGTISAWVKTSNAGSSYRSIIAKQFNYGLFLLDNILVTFDWGNFETRTTGTNLADGLWKNVVMSFTTNTGTPSNNAVIYLNGNSILTTTIKFSNDNENLEIGRGGSNSSGATQFINGNIASASIYNRALTAAEVQQNFNALRGRFSI